MFKKYRDSIKCFATLGSNFDEQLPNILVTCLCLCFDAMA